MTPARVLIKQSCQVLLLAVGLMLFHGQFNPSQFSPFGPIIKTSLAAETDKTSQKWTCPMHPHYIADEFGTCPICGMDLVKIQSSADDQNKDPLSKPIISISPEMIQTMGVRLAKAERAAFGKRIRSYGIVKENERLQTELSARVEGWVEKLNITAVGDKVEKGDVLFELFSPELIVSQRDFLAALSQSKNAQSSIKRRLLSFGVQQQALDLITEKKDVQQNIPFFAVQDGTVATLNVTPGSYVKRGMTIAKIQDYSEVWVIVNVSEKDMSFISNGTKANIYFPNIPGKTLNTEVDYIYPDMDEKTRTGRVRLIIDNKDGALRPGTYADVVFETQISERLSVPSEAILKDESGDYLVVALGEGRFRSRNVELGLVTGGRSEIKSGIKSGEDIVVSAQFLIDSESALRESFRKIERLQKPLNQLKLSKNELASFDHMVDAALYIHEALMKGTDIEESQLAPALAIKKVLWSEYKNTRLANVLTETEAAIKQAQSAKTNSERKIALNNIVTALEPWLINGVPAHYKSKKLKLYQTDKAGQKWVQLSATPLNPYNKKQAELIPWPDVVMSDMDKTSQKVTKDDMKETRGTDTMRGSGHAH